jgi:hypothetical protein
VSDYGEMVTNGFLHLTDSEWERSIQNGNAEDVPWMRDLVVRSSALPATGPRSGDLRRTIR